MKSLVRLWPLIATMIALGACNSMNGAGPAIPPPPTRDPDATIAPTSTPQPTPVPVPTELAYSTSLVQTLAESGVLVQSVQRSVLEGFFDQPHRAVWIQTDRGIVEAVYFDDVFDAKSIRVLKMDSTSPDSFLYEVRADPPVLADARTIDSAFPLYHLVHNEMFIETASEELYNLLEDVLGDTR